MGGGRSGGVGGGRRGGDRPDGRRGAGAEPVTQSDPGDDQQDHGQQGQCDKGDEEQGEDLAGGGGAGTGGMPGTVDRGGMALPSENVRLPSESVCHPRRVDVTFGECVVTLSVRPLCRSAVFVDRSGDVRVCGITPERRACRIWRRVRVGHSGATSVDLVSGCAGGRHR
ncbi:hypothetical protein Prubr_42100 [Polymorphospora rubra]|uniref:Uncharacterized protein n=1 Tax=Polymorphospora rubra TaxID=338584 RepID=A0A810N4S6_9ACTN|nr:hypothetical protein Prubr_42100 [Polymorphospora rubra]